MSAKIHNAFLKSATRKCAALHLRGGLILWSTIFLCCRPGPAPAATKPDTVRFNRDIRPILSDNCVPCHGPDQNKRKGKLRLDVREEAIAKEAIVPGKPAESEMI